MWKDGKGGAHTGTSRDEWARSWSTLWRASELVRQPESDVQSSGLQNQILSEGEFMVLNFK